MPHVSDNNFSDPVEPSLNYHNTSESIIHPGSVNHSEHEIRELSDIPAIEVISQCAILLMSAAAEKLGLSEAIAENSPHFDLDEARRLITGLAGLITSTVEYLGPHAAPLRDGLQSLQKAFRESSPYSDMPGFGPGEKYTGKV